jgi:S1-C subfamily serine protease
VADLISLTCPTCKTGLRVPATARGKTAVCKKCDAKFPIPAAAGTAPAPAAPAAFDFLDDLPAAPAPKPAPALKAAPARKPAPAAAVPEEAPRRSPWPWVGGGVAALALVGVVVAAALPGKKKDPAPADGPSVAKADPAPAKAERDAPKPRTTPDRKAGDTTAAVTPPEQPATADNDTMPLPPPGVPPESKAKEEDAAPAAPSAVQPPKKKKGPVAKKNADPPAVSAADRKERMDRVKQSVALVKGKYGHGSGFLVAPNVVATNSHVILTDLPDDVTVQFMTDGLPDKPLKARLLYEDSARDLALLLLDEDQKRPVLPVAKGVKPADRPVVCVVGNPGQGGGAALAWVAELARVEEDVELIFGQPYYRLTSAAPGEDIRLGPGNSGGPAVNAKGEVVGVLTRGQADARTRRPNGRHYLIPAKAVQDALDGLGPTSGWEELTQKAASRHAYVLYFVNLFATADVAMQVIDLRVKLKQQQQNNIFMNNAAQLAAKDKELTAKYQKIDKVIKDLSQPAQKAMRMAPLTPAQTTQIQTLQRELELLRGTVARSGFSAAEYKRAQDSDTRVRKAFEQFKTDSGMAPDLVIALIRAVEFAINN